VIPAAVWSCAPWPGTPGTAIAPPIRASTGVKLYLCGDGTPIMWCLVNPKLGEREVVTALLENHYHLIRLGQILFADKGFSGAQFADTTAARGLKPLRPDRKDETYKNGNLGGVRHGSNRSSTR
jgi:hypothetical protein